METSSLPLSSSEAMKGNTDLQRLERKVAISNYQLLLTDGLLRLRRRRTKMLMLKSPKPL